MLCMCVNVCVCVCRSVRACACVWLCVCAYEVLVWEGIPVLLLWPVITAMLCVFGLQAGLLAGLTEAVLIVTPFEGVFVLWCRTSLPPFT